MKRIGWCLLFLIFRLSCLSAQTFKQDSLNIFFHINSSEINFEYSENFVSLNKLDSILTQTKSVKSIQIVGCASPDGRRIYNKELSKNRALSIVSYLGDYNLGDCDIEFNYCGANEVGLRLLIAEDDDIPNYNQVLKLMDSGELFRSNFYQLKKMTKSYNYFKTNIFPNLRNSTVVVTYEEFDKIDKIGLDVKQFNMLPEVYENINRDILFREETKLYQYMFALKSNLLYDLATAVNIGIEIPINKFSIEGNWMFPWWVDRKWNKCFEMLSGTVGVNYWFGDDKLIGHHIGLIFNSGLYDFQFNKNSGHQGEFLICGIKYGYSMKLNHLFNLEFDFGIGYIKSDYRYYSHILGQRVLVKEKIGTVDYIGPVSAEINLSIPIKIVK